MSEHTNSILQLVAMGFEEDEASEALLICGSRASRKRGSRTARVRAFRCQAGGTWNRKMWPVAWAVV